MWKKVLGWVLFFGGIFCGVAAVPSSLQHPTGGYVPTGGYHTNFVALAFWVTVAVALIWGGWKLAHRRNKSLKED